MVPMGQIDEFWSPLVEIGPDESLGDLDDIITDILERIKDLEEAIDAIRDQIQGILDQIQGILDQIQGILEEIQAIRDLIQAIIDYIQDLRDRVDNAQAGVDVLAQKGRSVVVVLCERHTPLAGPDVVEAFVPHEWDGEELADWVVTRASVRVATSGGAPSVQFEKSSGAGIFIPTPITTVTLGNGAYEAAVSGVSGTVTSGDKLRMNVLEVGSAENWYVSVQLYHPFVVPVYSALRGHLAGLTLGLSWLDRRQRAPGPGSASR
jgi:hypothetical protein